MLKLHIYTLVWLAEFWLTRVIIPVFLLYEYCNEPIHYWHMPVFTTLLSLYLVKVFMIKSHRNIGCRYVPLLLRTAGEDSETITKFYT